MTSPKSTFDVFPPLKRIMNDVDKCIEAELYHPALIVALTLPDICLSLGLPKETFVKSHDYIEFIEKYGTFDELRLDGKQCYQLRGGVVHRANASGHPYFPFSHVIMTTPKTTQSIHGIELTAVDMDENPILIDLVLFCSGLKNTVNRWMADNQNNSSAMQNMYQMLSLRPHGVLPWVNGLVLASGPDYLAPRFQVPNEPD